MTTTRARLKVSFTAEEKEHVQALADQVKLSVSELLRRLALGHRLPDPGTYIAAQAIRDLLKVNADQARLGNLMKMLIVEADGGFPPETYDRISHLLDSIHEVQNGLRDQVKALSRDLRPRAAP